MSFQVALGVKNRPANAGDTKKKGSIPESEESRTALSGHFLISLGSNAKSSAEIKDKEFKNPNL